MRLQIAARRRALAPPAMGTAAIGPASAPPLRAAMDATAFRNRSLLNLGWKLVFFFFVCICFTVYAIMVKWTARRFNHNRNRDQHTPPTPPSSKSSALVVRAGGQNRKVGQLLSPRSLDQVFHEGDHPVAHVNPVEDQPETKLAVHADKAVGNNLDARLAEVV